MAKLSVETTASASPVSHRSAARRATTVFLFETGIQVANAESYTGAFLRTFIIGSVIFTLAVSVYPDHQLYAPPEPA
jgi:hypothetical protein